MDVTLNVDYDRGDSILTELKPIEVEGFDMLRIDGPGAHRLNGGPFASAEYRCRRCGSLLDGRTEPMEDQAGSATCPTGELHAQEPVPLGWLNSVRVRASESDDAIMLHISVDPGDPLGSFHLTVRRNPRDGQLYLYAPHPDDVGKYMPMREVRPGAYQITGVPR